MGVLLQKKLLDLPHCSELRLTQRGWFRRDQEPPLAQPPASRDSVKAKYATS